MLHMLLAQMNLQGWAEVRLDEIRSIRVSLLGFECRVCVLVYPIRAAAQ